MKRWRFSFPFASACCSAIPVEGEPGHTPRWWMDDQYFDDWMGMYIAGGEL